MLISITLNLIDWSIDRQQCPVIDSNIFEWYCSYGVTNIIRIVDHNLKREFSKSKYRNISSEYIYLSHFQIGSESLENSIQNMGWDLRNGLYAVLKGYTSTYFQDIISKNISSSGCSISPFTILNRALISICNNEILLMVCSLYCLCLWTLYDWLTDWL